MPGQHNVQVVTTETIPKSDENRPLRCDDDGYGVEQGYRLAVARGVIPRAEPFGAYGSHVAAGAVTNQLIWPAGAFAVPASTGVQMSIVSTSAQDGVNGTGIRSVHVHYLDAALAEQMETVTLNGLTPVLTTATDIRFVQCMHIATYGSGKAAAGTIAASNGGVTYSQIYTGENRCSSSARMVPAGKRLFVDALSAGCSSGTAAASVQVFFSATAIAGHDYTADAILVPQAGTGLQDSASNLTLAAPVSFEAGVVVAMTTTTDKAATVFGSWFGWLEDA